MQNFQNPAFRDIYDGITNVMPSLTFFGIIATYAITAALNVYFIPLPIYLSIPAALAIQFGRFSIVFMDFLNPTGKRSPWPPIIATLATLVAMVELGFSILHLEWLANKFWAVFLFGSLVISFGYLLEINFISKGAEAFGMLRGGRTEKTSTTNPAPQYQAAQKPIVHKEEPIESFFELSASSNGKH